MWRYMVVFTLAVLTRCAKLPPSGTAFIPGSPPRTVEIRLGSRVQHTPYSPEDLANPAIQSIIAECERQGGVNCREYTELANFQTRFVRTQDDRVVTILILGGLESNRDYTVRYKLFDPKDGMRARLVYSCHIPPSFPVNETITVHFNYVPPNPSTWQLGSWRIEIAVNGQVEGERTFEVVD